VTCEQVTDRFHGKRDYVNPRNPIARIRDLEYERGGIEFIDVKLAMPKTLQPIEFERVQAFGPTQCEE